MHTVVMLYPGHSAEDEFRALEDRVPGASLPVVHTWEGGTAHDVPALLALGSRQQLASPAARARALAPDAVMWACTSGSFVYGWEGCHEQAGWVREAAGAPASSTSLAFAAAVHHLGLRRASVAATYPGDVAAHFVDLLERDGITVTALSSYDVPSGEDAGALGPDWVRRVAGAADLAGAECLLVPDTALHTIEVLPELEAAAGVPVLTANQVTAWHGLALAGHPARAPGLGALFA
ncbi:maleate cis-trans isomerase [Citricoccus sp. SGAir0253]|uniref:maleate cis-trans isomerase family protein n=1 Tax=Citricoccus sp. SGAir0253 TaxID=2567881 RepID=UPI0010CD39FC|nr:maleate cis-trans isomerase [Citricoccus sp. SGAir0253]QCU78982.1 maleate cis-trans isomerase [Citricoccus sp. SGAir0253]